MNRGASKNLFLALSKSFRLVLMCMMPALAGSTHGQTLLLKTETFDADPGWEGRNNRATDPGARTIIQNFGYSPTTNAGGPAGEIGGYITPAGEAAFYGKVITPVSFNDPLSASGVLNVRRQKSCSNGRIAILISRWKAHSALAPAASGVPLPTGSRTTATSIASPATQPMPASSSACASPDADRRGFCTIHHRRGGHADPARAD